MDLSIVVPIYNEEESIPELVSEVRNALSEAGLTYELICVDDGSSDRSLEILTEMSADDPTLRVCELRRNFGQTAAMQAGFDSAVGRIIVSLDADLQNDPKDIPAMVTKLDEGFDMVAGWRAGRKDTFLNRRLPSIIANWIIGRTTNVRLHDYGCTLKATRRELMQQIDLYGEMHRFIPAIASLAGARICEVKVNHRARRYGTSKYGIGRTLRVILDLITVLFLQRYLSRPMQVFGLWGLVLSFVGFGICAYLAFMRIVYESQLADRPLLTMGVLMLLAGIQLVSLGLVADLLTRTYHEAQHRRPYFIRHWISGGESTLVEHRPGPPTA
ncbi:MAG: glycosyltransferase family 2 protein [Deltaproteobacteria bacterium]|nr:glycosyltransferase family 2 protein [Deltaproteobacteria bacterium]